MSGYGGRPPGWEDPYGQYGPYDPYNPYGQQPGYEYDYRYGYGPPGVPNARVNNGAAIAALVCNIVATVLCCNVFCIGGIVTAGVALGKAQTEPDSSRKLVMWSWVILGVSLALEIALIAVAVAVSDGSSDPTYGSGSGI